MVYFYTVLTREKGKDFFHNLMRDGAGYYLAAKTWIPFVPPQRAFVLYLCEDYRRIFETIWQDRAVNAGWNLDIAYEDPEGLECVFHLRSM